MKALFFVLFFVVGCTIQGHCESGAYNSNGDCCMRDCPNGYQEGTCNCASEDTTDKVDDLFEDDDSIDPPGLPQ